MLCLSGFELYSRWVPLVLFLSVVATIHNMEVQNYISIE